MPRPLWLRDFRHRHAFPRVVYAVYAIYAIAETVRESSALARGPRHLAQDRGAPRRVEGPLIRHLIPNHSLRNVIRDFLQVQAQGQAS